MRLVFRRNLVRLSPHSLPFFLILITDISSDAEAREEQDGRNQNSVQPTMAELWPILWPYVVKRMKKGFFCLFEPS